MTGPGQSRRAITAARLTLLVVVGALMAALPASALANQHGKRHHAKSHNTKGHGAHQNFGTVYTATNDPSGNAVVTYTRNANGTLTQGASFPTGGKGIASEPPFGFPIVDSSGSMNLTPDGRCCSSSMPDPAAVTGYSAFRVTNSGLALADNVIAPAGPADQRDKSSATWCTSSTRRAPTSAGTG